MLCLPRRQKGDWQHFQRLPRVSLLFEIISNFANNFGQAASKQNHWKILQAPNLQAFKTKKTCSYAGKCEIKQRKSINEHHGVCLPVILCNSNKLPYKHSNMSWVTVCKLDLKWMWYFIALTSFQFLWELLESLLALGGIESKEMLVLKWICKTESLSCQVFNNNNNNNITKNMES